MSISRQHTKTAASHTHQSKSDANPLQKPNCLCLRAKAATNGAKRQTMTALPCSFCSAHKKSRLQADGF
jgi:hypothetical protein